MSAVVTPTVMLRDGNSLPMIGFGTYLCSGEDVFKSVPLALEAGYVHIDTAEGYHNEEFVGQIIGSIDPMKRPFITTKLWPGGMGDDHKTSNQVIESCKTSVAKLQIPCIDLYLIHLPLGDRDSRLNQWKALVYLQQTLGIVRSIGVSNYNVSHLEEIRAAGLPLPVVNQLELHPLCQHRPIVEYCHQHGIALTAYSSLAPLAGWRTGQRSNKPDENIQMFEEFNALLQRIADDCSITPSQVLLRWALQHNYCILPKSTNQERIVQNLQVITQPLSPSSSPSLQVPPSMLPTWTLSDSDMTLLDSYGGGSSGGIPSSTGLPQDTPLAWPIGDPCMYDK